MAIIKKKIWPKFFKDICSGRKNFELRLNDFKIKKGDILFLQEYDPVKKHYTGRSITKKVGYIFKFRPDTLPFWSKKEVFKKGLQIISFDNKV